ncbi:DUF4150 domain-containing protein [Pyxidicoccus fallax]|uniref:DUF4150 domain-containing protein n=1 Tax=Pyxidicoccus fallax TaxID=394095 RepID=A0A848LA96_9BACT|nr:DUF4150 domain-containing protein [Pyxidicoccus fallax]NMO15809.1 DUF4150 domain-containing protein [Pyxidicoccus fallax]NPC79406.1 DUF4150 domain-containing protein [Pyxidicoccus fallax]
MTKVTVNAPKTPVTEGSSGVAAATLPNVCKMPGPPAPFVPTPLPNIGKSGQDPKNYSKTVTIAGKKVAVRGATFGSMGDVASKGTGGGLVSANVEGPTRFVGPGSMDVKFDGKNVQLLGDPMLNNCGPSGSPANAATMLGVIQASGFVSAVDGKDNCPLCQKQHGALEESQETRNCAQDLARKFESKVRGSSDEDVSSTMLGVVQCQCKTWKYADQSSVTCRALYDSVKELGAGWRAPKEADVFVDKPRAGRDSKATREAVRDFLKRRFHKDEKRLEKIWDQAERRFLRFKEAKSSPTSYPPGSCAGPKALLPALEHDAYPGSLTERWFGGTSGNPTREKIKFRNAKTGEVEERQFHHGETVPPCGACELLLPLMLCPGDKKEKCQHEG